MDLKRRESRDKTGLGEGSRRLERRLDGRGGSAPKDSAVMERREEER